MSSIRIWFTDFWRDFDPANNWFYHFLQARFDIVLDPHEPDFLLYSRFGRRFLNYTCTRIFYTGENVRPNFFECDYALSFDYNNRKNHYRLPLYGIYSGFEPERLTQPKISFDNWLQTKPNFCAFIVSAAQAQERIQFFKALSAHKFVHSGGRYLNNIGGPVVDKMDFLTPFRFTIAFENSSYPGYTTEKIFQPMFTGTIPIYWGNPLVHRDFNEKSFVNVHAFKSQAAAIEHVLSLDSDLDKLRQVYDQPWFSNNQVNAFIDRDNIACFFKHIFDHPVKHKVALSFWSRQLGIAVRRYRSYQRKHSN